MDAACVCMWADERRVEGCVAWVDGEVEKPGG